MKNKTHLILSLILIALALAASYPLWQAKILPKQEKSPDELNLQSFTKENTQTITIKNQGNEIKIEKKDSGWTVNQNFPVDEKTLDNFFSALASSSYLRLASKNPENHASLAVTEDQGCLVTLKNSQSEKNFFIGNYANEAETFYLRLKDNPQVYVFKGPLKTRTLTTVFDWRHKDILNLTQDQVSKVTVTGKLNFTLSKNQENKWLLSVGAKTQELKEDEINSLFSNLSPLQANDFLSEEQKREFNKLSLSKNTTKITFLDKDNQPLASLTIVEKDGDYWLKENNHPEIFKVYSFKLSPLFNLKDKI